MINTWKLIIWETIFMAEEKEIVPQGYKENPDLLPVPMAERKKGYNVLTFTFMMFSMNTCIPMFFLGPIGAGLGLDMGQALVGAFIGNLAAVIAMYLNGIAGVKYGIPYPVQLRESFGFKGMHIPVLLRGAAGTMWFGIEVWAGSYALTLIALFALGIPAATAATMAFSYVVVAVLFYVGSFAIVMRKGLKGIGRMADFAGPLMLLYFIWLVWFLSTNPSFPSPWGVSTVSYFSLPFLAYLAVQTNWWATVALNISDLSRGINPEKKNTLFWGLLIGIVIGQVVGTALGYAAVAMTGVILPQEIILKFAPGAIAILIGLIFAFVAPWSTDITANAPPLIDILMATVKLRWKTAVVVASVIAFFVAPWWAVGQAADYTNYMTNWASNYGILLGPIAGIMIGSFWVNRKRTLDLQKLYTYGPNGYWHAGGVSRSAYISLILTWIVCYIIAYPTGQIAFIGPIPFPGGVTWYSAIVASFIFQVLLGRYFKE
uniref:Cytosine permease n=1 Tax=Candidatus Methanomethylicus mesodigestus TaxID=1867258 RepID=A0A7C3IL21_9CREN